MRNYPHIGIQVADVLLPRPEVDPQKWAVIAVDQFTSQPEYWQQVAELVGDSPSTYHLTLPEVMLGTPAESERIQSAQQRMKEYLTLGLLESAEGIVYVERTVNGKVRHGLVLALDLEQYDYNKGAKTLVRASEGTILDRLPPRMKIRRGAPLELPHILVLIDDPQGSVVEMATRNIGRMEPLYDFELMFGSGHLTGYRVTDPALEEQIIKGFEKLADPQAFSEKYGVDAKKTGVLMYAAGDGNHSLATAKAVWEELKPHVGMDHPARYALVEIENVHDEGLTFEPIHRVLFNLHSDPLQAMAVYFGDTITYTANLECDQMIEMVSRQEPHRQSFGIITSEGYAVAHIEKPATNLPVGTLQAFLDQYIRNGGAEKIDYVHGEDVICELSGQPGNIGFFLPKMDKSELFKTVLVDGALPRKTFSMGEAEEKRFYMEARRIG
ncbi:MAG TPA: DUF1015 domain-containing protein [Anaerolineaceae bacterium]|nr:DUF1015 domain-containing protein [Anaerolineaceae bacterium]